MTRPREFAILGIVCLALGCASMAPSRTNHFPGQDQSADASPGLGHRLLFWLPNRIFDAFDMVRARARVGPGLSVGARATEAADVFVGSHTGFWIGLPGPRGDASIPLPAGIESMSGVEVSVVDVAADAGAEYGATEVGVGVQALLVGADVGIDPLEVLDFVVGILTFDLIGDDY